MIYNVIEPLIKLSDLVWVSTGLVPVAGASSQLPLPGPSSDHVLWIAGLESSKSKLSLNAKQKLPFVCSP